MLSIHHSLEGDFDDGADQVRIRPEAIDTLCKLTKFSRRELQLMYRGFKQVSSTLCSRSSLTKVRESVGSRDSRGAIHILAATAIRRTFLWECDQELRGQFVAMSTS